MAGKSASTEHRIARRAFDASSRKANFCNWCGNVIENRLIHHGDGNPANNVPDNLWALCGRTCHNHVHDGLLNGKNLIRSLGGKATAAKGGGFKALHRNGKGTTEYSEMQSNNAKAGVGECKARGARVANAKQVQCPSCDRVMNPGALGMHRRVHGGDSN